MLRHSSWKPWIRTVLWLIPCHVAHTMGSLIKAPTRRLNYSKATGMYRRPGGPRFSYRSADNECDLAVMAAIMLPDDLHINICFPEWRTHPAAESRRHWGGPEHVVAVSRLILLRSLQEERHRKRSLQNKSLSFLKIIQAIWRVVESLCSCPCSVTNVAQTEEQLLYVFYQCLHSNLLSIDGRFFHLQMVNSIWFNEIPGCFLRRVFCCLTVPIQKIIRE